MAKAADEIPRRSARWLWLIPALLLAALLTIFLFARHKPALKLVEKESWFSDFAVVGDRVYFLCRLTIRNPQDEPVYTQIYGDLSADQKGGLVLSRESAAFRLDEQTAAAFFSLSPEEKEAALSFEARLFPLQPGDNTFWAVFRDLHGESGEKQDRLLPPIRFTVLQDVTPEAVSKAMDCRIVKNPVDCDAFLVDGEELFALGDLGLGGYGFTSAVPWDYDFDGVEDILFTYSWGSGIHRSLLTVFDRNTREEQNLYVYYPRDFDSAVFGSDLLVELETDERGAASCAVYTADVTMNGWNHADLRFTKRAKAGVVGFALTADGSGSGPKFLPDAAFLGLPDALKAASLAPTLSTDAPEQEGFGCEVKIGGKTAWLQGEAAEALYRICLDAMGQGEQISTPSITVLESKPWLCLAFRVIPPSGSPEEPDFSTYCGTFWVYYDFEDDFTQFSPNPYASFMGWYRIPAGTYDALLEVLTDLQ